MQIANPLLKNYYAYALSERGFALNTAKNHVYELQKFMEWKKTQAFEEVHFTDYLMHRNLPTEICAGSVNNIRKTLNSFYHFLELEQIIKNNVAKNIDAPQKVLKIPRSLHAFHLYSLSQHYNTSTETGTRTAAIIETLYSTGMRINELINLKYKEFAAGYHYVNGKFKKQGWVFFNDVSKKYINQYLQQRKNNSDYLFSNIKGGRLSARSIGDEIKKLSTAAEIPFKVTPHTFRHTFATHLLEGGANIMEVKDLLRHESINSTLIYSKTDVRHLRRELQQHHPRW